MTRTDRKEGEMDNNIRYPGNEQSADPFSGAKSPAAGWWEILLAALPFLLILLADGLPKLLVEGSLLSWEDAGMRILNTGLGVLLVASLLAAFFLAWRRKWPSWSAVWYPFFCIPPLLLAVGLTALVEEGRFDLTISQDVVMYLWIPLIIAVLLYAVTRLDPMRGLMAALPVIYLLWLNNMEFVPDSIEIAMKVPSIALICLALAFMLRRGDWRTGLYTVLVVNLAVGCLFAYAGIYHGGTLPFVAPGPSLVEVARSLIPQYLATSGILLGPLFAWRFRQVGRSGGWSGKVAYHLALAGLLLVIMANLASLMLTLQVDSPGIASSPGNSMAPTILLGMGIYLVGVIWLYGSEPFSRRASAWAERALLLLLPLAIPIAFMLTFITWKWPVSNLYGIPLLWVLPHEISLSLGLVWLVLSAWVIARGGETPGRALSFQGTSEVFQG
jgi:hypothetical protein